jgi:hypothetical protein
MYQHDYVKPNIIETYIQENKRVTGMKITKQELKNFGACQEGFKRFIIQTNNTDEPVEVISLIGGKNTVSDLLWLAGKILSKEKIVRFACDCALLNIELIRPYTNDFNLIQDFLNNPSQNVAARAARAAYDAARAAARAACDAARAACDAATYAARAARAATYAVYDATYAVYDAYAAAYAVYDAYNAYDADINKLLVKLFTE